jgi:hypothetical protein
MLLQTLTISCRLQSLSGDPASAADPSLKLPGVALFRASASFFHISFDFFADQKIIKKQTSRKTSPNLKNRTPERPKLDFGAILVGFRHPFSALFSHLFSKC